MRIGIVGADARALCRAAGVGAEALPSLRAASGGLWELLALTPDAAREPSDDALRALTLLLPGDSAPALALDAGARQVVSYGFSPRDTLTLSSLAGTERLLCLQRSVVTVDGALLEPQELPLPAALCRFSGEAALLAAGLRLLCARQAPDASGEADGPFRSAL